MAFENANFSFSEFFFSRLWRTLARKLMKRPAVFITYFQSTIQIVHVYQILRSEYFFQKFVGRFNLMSTFFAFHHFCEKTYEKTYWFYDLFSNFQLLCARSQNFVVWNFFTIKLRPFLNVNNFLFISATLSNICDKTYEKTYRFFKYFETSTSFLHVYKICRSANLKKMLPVSICEQNLVYSSNFEQYFPQKLWKTVQF